VHEWLAAQPKTFFSEGIQKLLERWNKCIAKHGDYTEKLYNCKVCAVVEINYKNCVWILFDLPKYYQKMDLKQYQYFTSTFLLSFNLNINAHI